jgi:ATP-dependent Clp protease adaptor protein ClpS
MATDTQTERDTRTQPKNAPRPKQQPPYNVVLIDDSDHTFDYVIEMMGRVFGYAAEKGFQIAETVHMQGRAVVLTTTKEHAELKRDQIHAFGADARIKRCKGSMRATIEPVEG